MNLIIHLTIEVENMADLGELMPTLVDLDPIDITVHAHQPIAADATPSGSPASGPVASQTVLDEINGLITAHDDQQPHSEPYVAPIAEKVGHQATQIDDINRRLDDYLSRFNGLLADFNGLCTKVERMVTK